MKTVEQIIEEGMITRLANNFSRYSTPSVMRAFDNEELLKDYDGETPLKIPISLCQTKRNPDDGINLLDLGCGSGNQMMLSAGIEKAWSTGLDASKKMLDRAAHNLKGGRSRFLYKKAVALVRANMNDPSKNDFYALLDRPGLLERLRPRATEKFKVIKNRKILEVKEVLSKPRSYFDIIVSNASFPLYVPHQIVNDIVELYTGRLKPGGLWHLSYDFIQNDNNCLNVSKNIFWFNHDPESIRKLMKDYNMKLIKNRSECFCGTTHVENVYRLGN